VVVISFDLNNFFYQYPFIHRLKIMTRRRNQEDQEWPGKISTISWKEFENGCREKGFIPGIFF